MGEPLRDARGGAGAPEGAGPAHALGGRAGDLVPRAPLSGLAAFRSAVEEYELVEAALEPAAVAAARRALDAAGLLLVGEAHGVAQTPSVLYALARALDARGLALEWSHDEVGPVVGRFAAGDELDLEALWRLSPGGDFLAGDGRVTAGHVVLLRRLRDEGRLEQLVLLDRLGSGSPPGGAAERERELAARLLAEWRRDVRLLAVVGAGHVQRAAPDAEPMAAHVARAVPGVATALLEHAGGACWFHGVRPLEAAPLAADVVFRLGPAEPAAVPLALV